MPFQGFVNLTPFAAQPLLLADERGADVLTCVVKATFRVIQSRDGAALAIADEQLPVCTAPVHYGDPAMSSVKYDAETALAKLGTDIVLIGHAHATLARAQYVDVSLGVGPARAIVRVFGDRVWTTTLGRWTPSAPIPFEQIPLVYERAFGGWDRAAQDETRPEFESRNPVGVGFVSKKQGAPREGDALPNLENPYEPIRSPADRPAPAGFGFIGAHWQPRSAYAGTYDEAWREHRMPLLPDDFNRRFYSAAHPLLAMHGFLRGGEPVEVLNASASGELRFQLPVVRPFATVKTGDGALTRVAMVLDTIILNTDENIVIVLWRGSLPIIGGVHSLAWAKTQLAPGSQLP